MVDLRPIGLVMVEDDLRKKMTVLQYQNIKEFCEFYTIEVEEIRQVGIEDISSFNQFFCHRITLSNLFISSPIHNRHRNHNCRKYHKFLDSVDRSRWWAKDHGTRCSWVCANDQLWDSLCTIRAVADSSPPFDRNHRSILPKLYDTLRSVQRIRDGLLSLPPQ